MSMYAGSLCPFCNEPIQDDSVVVCPSCGIPHHRSCWEKNKGCTTFGCPEQHFEPAPQPQAVQSPLATPVTTPAAAPVAAVQAVCTACGAPLAAGQAFCTNCGAPQAVAPQAAMLPKRCPNCGNEVEGDFAFCNKCGQRLDQPAPVAEANPAIAQFNASIAQPKKKKGKTGLVVVSIILVVCILVGIFAANAMRKEREAAAKAGYLSDAQEFLSFSLTAGANVEKIVDTVQSYWYDSIWKDKYGSDINVAIAYALRDKKAEITLAETHYNTMTSLYNRLKSVPSDVADEDRAYLQNISNAVLELYGVYQEFYEMAIDPSGSYKTYSAANGELTDEFLDLYDELDKLLN